MNLKVENVWSRIVTIAWFYTVDHIRPVIFTVSHKYLPQYYVCIFILTSNWDLKFNTYKALKWYVTAKMSSMYHLLTFRCLEMKSTFFSFQHSSTANSFFLFVCFFKNVSHLLQLLLLAVYGDKVSKPLKHLKTSIQKSEQLCVV